MWIAKQPLGLQNRASPDPRFGSLPRHLTCPEMATEHVVCVTTGDHYGFSCAAAVPPNSCHVE